MDADEALVAEAAKGNRDAFDDLVTRYRTKMYQLARILTGGDGDAEDLVQETFVRAFRSMSRFRGDSTFRTWLHRIAVNVIRSHMAHRRRRMENRVPRRDVDDADDGMEDVASREDLETAIVRRQTIDKALASLPDDMRLLITLRDVQGLEYREIATITGLPMGTVESRIFRGRRRLRPLLAPLLAMTRQERDR